MEKSTIQVDELDESDDFLLELAAIEAEAEAASAAKRPKVAVVPVPEGPYMAALKGSKSEQWQLNPLNPASKSRGGFQGGTVNSNYPAGNYGSEAGEQDFPEKNCPCGNGVCSILTSNTQKNPGRKFYKCPNREENGGCGFFQWCDAVVQSSGTQHSYGNTYESKFPDLQCPCGAGLCRVLTAKTGENIGRQFYRCPVFEGSCGFFKWCNDDAVKASTTYSFTSNINVESVTNAGSKDIGRETAPVNLVVNSFNHQGKESLPPRVENVTNAENRDTGQEIALWLFNPQAFQVKDRGSTRSGFLSSESDLWSRTRRVLLV
ncbi:unnamed protein product [Eruca vesicaria subsp. sativa]|uniref:GRF-type domain-containing protein n=1 Tax=Eruca vesicaria subsp. sativa TaxID=29727 RepID=A0ABC8M8Z7_ERUVS|nr:unnamed protein product [Eruca vesicaria subsp. sativa]